MLRKQTIALDLSLGARLGGRLRTGMASLHQGTKSIAIANREFSPATS